MNRFRLTALAVVIMLMAAPAGWLYFRVNVPAPMAAAAGVSAAAGAASGAPVNSAPGGPDNGGAHDAAPGSGAPSASAGSGQEGHPRLEASLASLAALPPGSAAARDYATRHRLSLTNGSVRTVIEAAPSQAREVKAAVRNDGGTVETAAGDLVQAMVPVDKLAELSNAAAVSRVRPPAIPDTFSITSEGLAPMNVPAWQSSAPRGAGVKVAVLDPGFSGYQSLVAAGELPAGVITRSFRADGDITGGGEVHGAACAEIVYDIAPGAQLYLVNFGTEVELSNAVDWLISQHVDVISSSWGFFGGWPSDGTGYVDAITQRARDNGILWTSAAGNLAQAHWSGQFANDGGDWNLFSGAQNTDPFYVFGAEYYLDIYLSWNQWPAASQDYDLYLYKYYSGSSGPSFLVADSANTQNGSQPPEEEIAYDADPFYGGAGGGWYYLKIYKKPGSASGATLNLYSYPYDLTYRTAAGSLGGAPSDSPAVVTAGAMAPGSSVIESYSSQGPTADGRIKPDITGYDRVSTVTYGAQQFAGTSAAGPHAAGAAVLLKSENPLLTPAQLQNEMEGQALDRGVPGKDNIYGSGSLRLFWPEVSNIQPTVIYSGSTTVSASLTDLSGSGLNPAAVSVTVDGSPLTGCSVSSNAVSCPVASLTPGSHSASVSVTDNNGNTGTGTHAFDYYTHGYFWSWYDNQSPGAADWVMMANPAGSPGLNYGLAVGQTLESLPGGGAVAGGQTLATQFPGLIGGPVNAGVFSAAGGITSQRSLWAGASLEELPGRESSRLTDHYYWPWYDQQSPGYTDWVIVSNPSATETVHADISFTGQNGPVSAGQDIAPGQSWTPTFPGEIGGPLELKSYLAGSSWQADPRPVIASQRVLSGYGGAFNEVTGVPAGELSDRYLWTWYDEQSAGAMDWVVVTNPAGAAADIYYQIDIGGGCEAGDNTRCLKGGPLPPGEHVTPDFPGVMSGPVEVRTFSDAARTAPAVSIASQRTLWGSSFEEVPGLPSSDSGGFSSLGSTYYWTWYDQKTAGSQNWVMLANPDPSAPIYYEITIGSGTAPAADGTLSGGQHAYQSFPDVQNGPVRVQAWTDSGKSAAAHIIASQRVLWNGYFNEVPGEALN